MVFFLVLFYAQKSIYVTKKSYRIRNFVTVALKIIKL